MSFEFAFRDSLPVFGEFAGRPASQHAQQIVLRSHSGDPINGFGALVLKEMASQETKASSC